MGNNFRFDISCGPLEESLKIAFYQHKATCWKFEGVGLERDRLIFAWHQDNSPGYNPFVAPVGPEEAVTIVKSFLAKQDYGPEPDHDGSNKKSWRIYNEEWGHVGGNHYAFAAVEPVWEMFGK